MLFSTLQFFIATLLAVICARVVSDSGGDIPLIAMMAPVLWFIPLRGFASAVFVGSVIIYGLTLPYQPTALSVSVWILFPLLMVSFSRRSHIIVAAVAALIVITLQAGIMVTQNAGKLTGEAIFTAVQTLAVVLIWWSTSHWKPRPQHRWWALLLLLPLWFTQMAYAVLFALAVIGIVGAVERLSILKTFNWGKLLCWTLPTVAFSALVISPHIEVPNPIFVVWLCLLGTAWATDYILQSAEYNEEI